MTETCVDESLRTAAVDRSGATARDSAETSDRWLGLDAVRGAAALSVALFHFSRPADQLPRALAAPLQFGWLGVTAFFVVSGVVIASVLGSQPVSAGRFIARRMMRLAPPYLVVAALAVALNYLSSLAPGYRGDGWVTPSAASVACNILYTCDFVALPWFLVVTWSLAIEVQFYLLACGIAWTARRASARVAWMAAGAVTLASLAGGSHWVWAYAPQFALGALVWASFRGLLTSRAALGLAVAAVLLAAVNNPPETVGTMAVTAAAIAATRRWQPSTWLRRLGLWSYSLYLIHVPIGGRVMNLLLRFAHSPTTQFLAIVAAAAMSIAFAWVVHRWIERPSLDLSRRVAYQRTQDAAP